MRLDPATLATVASALLVACKPSFQPEAPGGEPSPIAERHHPAAPGGQGAMLAELCLDGLDGRPALAPIAMRAVSWSTEREEFDQAFARGQVPQFVALAFDGTRAGSFAVVGAADVPAAVALGSYTGGAPCVPGGVADGVADRACLVARRGCGLAVAPLGAAGGLLDDERAAPVPTVGGGCVEGADLAIDIDGDGAAERFAIGALLDGARVPNDEVSAVAAPATATCTPRFSTYAVAVPGDGIKVELDVLGVLDLDGDGWREVVLGLRYPDRRTIVVYSATASTARLDLVGEIAPWEP